MLLLFSIRVGKWQSILERVVRSEDRVSFVNVYQFVPVRLSNLVLRIAGIFVAGDVFDSLFLCVVLFPTRWLG